MKCLVIPKEINQEYVLLWKRDEVGFLIVPWLFCFMPGGMLGFSLTCILLIIVANLLKQLSVDKPNGYMIHYLKFNFPKQYVNAVISSIMYFRKVEDLDTKESLIFQSEAFPPSYIRYIAG
ncbi:MAG: hypothetical protein E6Q32_10945 [Neisseriales bacterium]|nr:MAG: hypothetical protein E6Q32_10945 [Neisseriales bacterium]